MQSPSTPAPSAYAAAEAGLTSASKGPQKVLRLVARPHATIVPGNLTSKELLARAAARSPSPAREPSASPRSWKAVPLPFAWQDEKSVKTAKKASPTKASPSPLRPSDLWELVWQSPEDVLTQSAQLADTLSDDMVRSDANKRRRTASATTPRSPATSVPAPAIVQASKLSSDSVSKTDLWVCPVCEEINKAVRTNCHNCNASRPQVASAFKGIGDVQPRRRLVGKQPRPEGWPTSRSRSRGAALEWPYEGQRFSSPGRDHRASAFGDAHATPFHANAAPLRGHYDVLGLPKTATGTAIRAAYRRRALATHPDKGGDPDEFRRVVAAFEELGDESRRIAYDQNIDLFGSLDGSSSQLLPQQQPRPEDIARWWYGAARIAQFKLLTASPDSWQRQICSMQEAEIHALLDLLRGSNIPVLSQAGDGTNGTANRRKGAPTAEYSATQGIERSKSGYRVVMSWASLSVASSTTRSLAQAIDWQIALAWLRATAQARLRQCLGEAADPLIEKELLEALAAEPAMSLTFTASAQMGGLGKKVDTPELPDLARVLNFQRRLRAAACHSYARMESTRKQLDKEARKDGQDYKKMQKALLTLAEQELEKRASARGRGRSRSRSAAVLKRPASASVSVVDNVFDRFNALHFRPTKRVRGKSAPALLAILEGPSTHPAKSRQAIVSKALEWQGIPQPGTPVALQDHVPSPTTPDAFGATLPCASPKPRASPRNRTPQHDSPLRPSASPRDSWRHCHSPSQLQLDSPRRNSRPCASPVAGRAPQRQCHSPSQSWAETSPQRSSRPSASPAAPRAPQSSPATSRRPRKQAASPSPASPPANRSPRSPRAAGDLSGWIRASGGPPLSWPSASPVPRGAPRSFSPDTLRESF